MGALEKANAPGQGGASRNRKAVDDGNHTKSPDARNRYRIGLWPEHLALLFDRLTGNEVKRFLRFKLDYLYNDVDGLPDDGKALPRALALKLLRLGLLRLENGTLIDDDLSASIARQRQTRERQQAAARRRWDAKVINGGRDA